MKRLADLKIELVNLNNRKKKIERKFENLNNQKIAIDVKIMDINIEIRAVEAEAEQKNTQQSKPVIFFLNFINRSDQQEDNDNGALSCDICFYKYDDTVQQSCITTCFHSFCENCLKKLEPKVCPKCRISFTSDQIKKIF